MGFIKGKGLLKRGVICFAFVFMIHRIEKEKKSAEHLLFASMKYTKTCDVIINLLHTWRNMIEICVEAILERTKKKKIIPEAPRARIEVVKKVFKKNPVVMKTMSLYLFLRRMDGLEQVRKNEFRKNVTLEVIDAEKVIEINMDKLKEWYDLTEEFLKEVRHYIK